MPARAKHPAVQLGRVVRVVRATALEGPPPAVRGTRPALHAEIKRAARISIAELGAAARCYSTLGRPRY